MGGDREQVIPQKKMGNDVTMGSLRFHESVGEVHFHDDANGLKVAMPSATWFEAYQRLIRKGISLRKKEKKNRNSWHYVDSNEGTVLHVAFELSSKKGKSKVDANLYIEPLEQGEIFNKLSKFTVG